PVWIDFHYDGLLRFRNLRFGRIRLFLAGFFFRFFLCAFFLFFLLSFLFGFAHFVTARSERILGFFREGDEIHALHVAINIREGLFAERRLEIARRTQQQILSVIAEHGLA